ncbi:MAG: hypothetical protein EOP48_20600, partial [Sphingobacteriales bacterium]
MHPLPSLIVDLGLILGAGAVMTLIFKRLKQPIILGYLVAGLLVGPNFPLFPTVSTHKDKPSNKPYFNHRIIKDFAQGLRGDSLECYEYMYDVRYLFDKQVLAHYQEIHNELMTIPLVFLSVVKTANKDVTAIYLWQFNECCPIETRPTKMAIDCPFKRQVYVPHNSILLLGKFVTTDQEKLLHAEFLSDRRILIKSRLSDSHIRLREYDMMDLIDLIKINPYDARSDNKFHCASKLDLSVSEENVIDCDLSRIRRLKEIELLEYHSAHKAPGMETLSMFIKTDSQKIVSAERKVENNRLEDNLFSEFYTDKASVYNVLVDRRLNKAILFKKDCLKIVDLANFGEIQSIFQNQNLLYFLNQEGHIFSMNIFEGSYQNLEVKIELDGVEKIKLLKTEDSQYLVYLKEGKFYATELEQKGETEVLFNVEEIKTGEEEEER